MTAHRIPPWVVHVGVILVGAATLTLSARIKEQDPHGMVDRLLALEAGAA